VSLSRWWRLLLREVIRRPFPHGVLHPRFLLPGQSRQVGIHRTLWRMGRPRSIPVLVWWPLELLLWLRWALWSGWGPLWRTVRRLGPVVAEAEGIPVWRQGLRLARISLLGGIPAAALYPFCLYRADGARRMWDYLYDTETVPFHRWESAPLGLSRASLDLVQDKAALSEAARALGVATAGNLGVLPKGGTPDLPPYLDHPGGIFVKLRSGNRAEDAFALARQGGRLSIRCLHGKTLEEQALPDHLRAMAAKDDLLVQPLLTTHPDLQTACAIDDVATLRLITRRVGEEVVSAWAMVELAVERSEEGHPLYVILALAEDGRIKRFPEAVPLPAEARARIAKVEALLSGQILPGWTAMRQGSLLLHQRLLPDLATIAWDWALTPQGGRLLEGNFGRGMQLPQTIHGGLLRDGRDG